jgi:hypothetical protein
MAPHIVIDHEKAAPDAPDVRLSLDSALKRRGPVDGGWWPRTRDATAELPGLLSALSAHVGTVVRLSVDGRDWENIPRRLLVDGHRVRIGHFSSMNHKIIATRGAQDHIMLLVVPPQASPAAAESALEMASAGRSDRSPEEILAASGYREREERGDIGRWVDDGAPSPDHLMTNAN